MLIEALVIYGCTVNHCTEMTAAYNAQNPIIMQTAKKVGDKAKVIAVEYTGEFVVNTIIPVVGWTLGTEANIKVYKNLVIKIEHKEPPTLGFRYEF